VGRNQQQYVMVTKQRQKSGCVAGFFHLIGGIFTLGMWPMMVWLSHLIGPRRKQITHVYGQPPGAPQQQYGQPQGYYPPQWQQPPQYGNSQPVQQPPPDWRWDPYTQQWVPPQQ